MTKICNFDEYLGPEKYRRQVGVRKPSWKCGMCNHINAPRNRARCATCGAVKGYGVGYRADLPANARCDCVACKSEEGTK